MSNNTYCAQNMQFRWINAQCFQFRFPNGKVLVTDPFYRWEGSSDEPIYNMSLHNGFSAEDLGQADYVFLNHCHGDHIYNLQEVCDRYHPTVITHSATAMELAKCHNIPLTSIYPVDFGSTCYFEGFKMEFYHGMHHAQKANLEERMNNVGLGYVGQDRKFLSNFGSIFNMNFVLTTREGLRIAFIGGKTDGMIERLREHPVNIIIRNKMKSSRHTENVAKEWSDFMVESNATLMVPMHYETWLNTKPGFAENVFEEMNQIMKERGKIGRVAPMERTKWYSLDLCISPM